MKRTSATPRPGAVRVAAIAVLLALALAACTAPQKAERLSGPLPGLSPGQARIVFYRPDNAFLGFLKPDIVVNRQTVGEAIVGSVFDRPAWPGEYTVFLAGHEDEALAFTLAPGETRYLRVSPHFALTNSRLMIEPVGPDLGEAETQGLQQRGEAN